MKSNKPRLFILGLDGASYHLMKMLIASGCLPTFATFARTASRAPLRCTWPPHTGSGWPSLFTGRLPGEHALFQFWRCQAPDYQLHVSESQDVGSPILWDVFAEQDWTMGLINIPMSHPLGKWPGYQISWPLVPTLRYCRPSSLLREISSVGGLALPDIACMYDGSPDYPARAIEYVQRRTKSILHLMQNYPTDVIAVVYTEIDRVCHPYWHGLDKNHPQHELASNIETKIIADVYAEIDKAFGEILKLLDDECIVLVVSDHGFGPGTRGLRLQHLLEQGGYSHFHKNLSGIDSSHVTDEANGLGSYLDQIAWEHTLAYMPVPGCFGVNLNLKGRQRLGQVGESDREPILRNITDYLLEIKDPKTNQPVFDAIVRSEIAYAGPYAAQAPDLLLVPKDPALMVLSDLTGSTWEPPKVTGLHRLEGVWMLRAPKLQTGELKESVAIEAVAGHLLTVLDISNPKIPIRDDVNLASINMMQANLPNTAWALTEEDLRGLAFGPRDLSQNLMPERSEQLSNLGLDEKQIQDRLRALGYL